MAKTKKVKRYTHAIMVRVPKEVYDAVMKRVKNKREKFPSYTEAEVLRKALVKHLKSKGDLDENKNYL